MGDRAAGKNDEQNPDRLSTAELKKTRERYKNLTKAFKEWIEDNAKQLGWTKTRRPRSPRSWSAEVQKLRDYRNDMNKKLGFTNEPENVELESPFQGQSVLQIAQQADFLKEKGVKLPQNEQANLEKCIELRRKANRHFSSFEKSDMKYQEDWTTHQKSNRDHEFFIKIIWYIKRMLWDPEYYFAMKLYKIFSEMRGMTDEVMEAWKQYKSSGVGLIQATLITHAAVVRAYQLEEDTYQEMTTETENDQGLIPLISSWNYNRSLNHLNVDNKVYPPSLLADVRGLMQLDQDDQKISSVPTLRDNLELVHFPTIPALKNFQVISKLWDSQTEKFPVPGYPVDLGHVDPGNLYDKAKPNSRQGKKRKIDDSQQKARKKLKTTYDNQIKLIWKYLNEAKLLSTYFLPQVSPGARAVVKLIDPADEAPYFPPDLFSVTMNRIINGSDTIPIRDSFSIQLLVKINSLFDDATVEKKELLHLHTIGEVADEFISSTSENSVWEKKRESRQMFDRTGRRSAIYEDNYSYTWIRELRGHLHNMRAQFPSVSGKFEWEVNSEGRKTFHVTENLKRRKVRIPDDGSLGRIDHSHFPDKRMDVSWFADLNRDPEDANFYMKNQPLFVGHLALKRRLVDYQADLNHVNDGAGIFVLFHLILALNVIDQKGDPKDRQDHAILDHNPEWIPAAMPANATEMLQLVESRLPRAGGQYDFSETSMKFPKPVDTLWDIFMGKNSLQQQSLDVLAWQLEEYRAEGQAPPTTGSRRPLPWPKLVSLLKRGLLKLACGDVERSYWDYEFLYRQCLGKLGKDTGCVWNEQTEHVREYHARLLYFILDDYKTKEDINMAMKAQGHSIKGWRSKTHLSKVKYIFEYRDKEARDTEKFREEELEKMKEK
ncbi:hypothetical protein IWX49DRAFT_550909 [Phyllosticta citricarpa]